MKAKGDVVKVEDEAVNGGQADFEQEKIRSKKKGSLVSIRLESSGPNLKRLSKIAGEFKRRYEHLVQEGYFSDAQEKFIQAMNNENENLQIVVALNIGIRNVSKSNTTMPLKNFLLEQSKHPVGEISGDNIFLTRYVVGNRIELASNEACPNCWSTWPDKWRNRSCPECKMEIGKEVRFLIENDCCPKCNHEGITESGLKCRKCDCKIDEEMIAWGGK